MINDDNDNLSLSSKDIEKATKWLKHLYLR
jgi:hypothetical protein